MEADETRKHLLKQLVKVNKECRQRSIIGKDELLAKYELLTRQVLSRERYVSGKRRQLQRDNEKQLRSQFHRL